MHISTLREQTMDSWSGGLTTSSRRQSRSESAASTVIALECPGSADHMPSPRLLSSLMLLEPNLSNVKKERTCQFFSGSRGIIKHRHRTRPKSSEIVTVTVLFSRLKTGAVWGNKYQEGAHCYGTQNPKRSAEERNNNKKVQSMKDVLCPST
jgi:hypothetical protein